MNKEDTNKQERKVDEEEAGSAAVSALRKKMELARKASHVNKVQQDDGQWRGFD